MKSVKLTFAVFGVLFLSALTAMAENLTTYEITITNGAAMPISPAVIYVKSGGEPAAKIGQTPSVGFIQLCQMGKTERRLQELRASKSVHTAKNTMEPILPGESRKFDVSVQNPAAQSIHIETMYGKTKDVCGVGSLNSQSLVALKGHLSIEIIQEDHVVLTGAFMDPVLKESMGMANLDFCQTAADAISCLRELAVPNSMNPKIRFFPGYLPSVISALEMKYGAKEVQSLLMPVSGAIRINAKLKH